MEKTKHQKLVKSRFDKQNKRIVLLEDAFENDYIDIVALSSFNEFVKQEHWKSIIDEYKGHEEYIHLKTQANKVNELQNQINELKQQKQKEIIEAKNQAQAEFISTQKYQDLLKNSGLVNTLQNQIEELKKQHEKELNKKAAEAINQFKSSQTYLDLVKTAFLAEQLQKDNKKIIDAEVINAIEKFKQENEEYKQIKIKANQAEFLKQENDELKRQKEKLNIKKLGEELENWINNDINNNLIGIEDIKFTKANDIKDGTKPDFLFEVFSDEKKTISLGKIVIEAKTEYIDSLNKKTNFDHLKKLEKDRIANKAEFALLVSELELDDEFIIKKYNGYENIFVIRPFALKFLLLVIRNLYLTKKEVVISQIDFKQKNEILNEFEQLKNEILNNSLTNAIKKAEVIKDSARKIKESAIKIENECDVLFNTHLEVFKKKLENFAIKKLTKKLEEISS